MANVDVAEEQPAQIAAVQKKEPFKKKKFAGKKFGGRPSAAVGGQAFLHHLLVPVLVLVRVD